MNIGRCLSDEAQKAARELIQREGLSGAAKKLRLTKHTIATGAAGAPIAGLAAEIYETRVLPKQENAA